MMKFILVCLAVGLLSLCGITAGYKRKDECFCDDEYDPVCGKDGKTYSNSCNLACAHIGQACEGECPCKPKYGKPGKAGKPGKPGKPGGKGGEYKDGCICTLEYDPVCGKDGKTYSNSCFLRCAHVGQACEGECPCKPKYGKPGKPGKAGKPKCPYGKCSPPKRY